MKTSPHQLDLATSQIQDVYQALEQEIFEMFCERLKSKGLTEDNVLHWQAKKLGELHLVNQETIKLVSKTTGIAKPLITKLFNDLGVQVYKDTVNQIERDKGSANSTNVIDEVMRGYVKQTFLDLDNNVNQTMITTNFGQRTPVTDTYQQIVKETTGKVIAGLKTPDKALAETIYKWRDAGLLSGFTDKGGHHWTIDSYARTVIGATTSRAFQAARNQAAEDNNIDTFVMSSHPASRPACAPIQGKLVTTRPNGFYAAGEWFEPLDNHGYGNPGGTFGINCRHIKWPYIPGVNSNNQPQYDAAMAVKNGNIQQKQRGLERMVRTNKQKLDLAQRLDDQAGSDFYSAKVRKYQSGLRQLVKNNSFLSRDYEREKNYSSDSRLNHKYKAQLNKSKLEFNNISSKLGKYAPKTLNEYCKIRYNDVSKAKSLQKQADSISELQKAFDRYHLVNDLHSMPSRSEPNSVTDFHKNGAKYSRRFYDDKGKPKKDIDYTNTNNPKLHPVIPHAHEWNFDNKKPRSVWRDLNAAEKFIEDWSDEKYGDGNKE